MKGEEVSVLVIEMSSLGLNAELLVHFCGHFRDIVNMKE